MKRKYTLITLSLLLFVAINARAQVKSYIDLYGGVSIPRSDFGSTDYSDNKAGFAKRGATVGIDGAYYIYKKLAIGGSIIFQDQGELTYNDALTLAQGYTNSYKADFTTVNTVGRYHSINFMLGPQYSFQYHKFILDLRAEGGVARITQTPTATIEISGVPEQTAYIYQRGGGSLVPVYGGTAGLRFKFSDNWTVGIRGAYFYNDGAKVNTDGLQEPAEGRLVTRVPMTVLQTTIGLSVNL
jgi:hypothetical protein